MTDEVDDFVRILHKRVPNMVVTVDRPDDPRAEVFIDISSRKRTVTVSYRPNLGFGIYGADSGYGERPLMIVASSMEAARRIAPIRRRWDKGAKLPNLSQSKKVMVKAKSHYVKRSKTGILIAVDRKRPVLKTGS